MTQGEQIAAAVSELMTHVLPDTLVTIISNGQTAQGIRSTTTSGESFTNQGERGVRVGKIRVLGTAMTAPERGSTININGENCIVGQVSTDMLSAMLVIDYQLVEPVVINT